MYSCQFTGPNNAGGAPQQSYNSSGSNVAVSSHLNPNPPSNAYYPNSRARANSINHVDRISPALARLQHMSQDVISGCNALTPVLNRDDAIKGYQGVGTATVRQGYGSAAIPAARISPTTGRARGGIWHYKLATAYDALSTSTSSGLVSPTIGDCGG